MFAVCSVGIVLSFLLKAGVSFVLNNADTDFTDYPYAIIVNETSIEPWTLVKIDMKK